MNTSKDGISSSNINSYALQGTVSIGMTTVPVSFIIGFGMSMLGFKLYFTIPVLIAVGIGFSLTCYFFLKKAFGAMAYDAAKKGIDEQLYVQFKKHDL